MTRRALVLVLLVGSLAPNCPAHPFEEGGPATESTRMPAPAPFSLSGRDAVTAIAMIERVGFLTVVDTGGADRYPQRTVAVRRLWAVFLAIDDSFPEGHTRRYDLVVNGSRLEWDRTYIHYDGRRLLLQQLFTYRNQHPVPWGLPNR